MPIPELQNAVQSRGDASKIARYAGVSESTIGRLLRGKRPNPGIETVAKIQAACKRLEAERASATAQPSQNADKINTKSRKSSAIAADQDGIETKSRRPADAEVAKAVAK